MGGDDGGTLPADRHMRSLEHLLAIAATALGPALDEAADVLHQALDAEKIDVFLHEPATDTLVALGVSSTPLGDRQRAIGMDRLPLANGGRVVEVYERGEAYLDGHVEDDPEELPGVRVGLGVRSVAAAPIEAGGRRRGVLAVQSTQPERFAEADLRFVAAAARWVGLVAQRAELVEELTRAAAERGQRMAAEELVTVLAHDLRNHLTPLQGRLALLRRRAARERHAANGRDAEAALADVARLERMIGELLDVARLEQGLFALRPRPVDLADLAIEAAARFQTAESPIDVRAAEELVAEADPDRVRQALENLLANAVAHSPVGAAVVLEVRGEARDDGRWAVLTVSDQGPGIAPDQLPRLFAPFASGAQSTGLGLGLYLAHEIARAHGGELSVQTSPGEGARFALALPAGADEGRRRPPGQR